MALSINFALPLLAMMLLATLPAICTATDEPAEVAQAGGRFLESTDTGAHARKLLGISLCGAGSAPNFSCKTILPFAVNATCCPDALNLTQACYDVGVLFNRCGSCSTRCSFGQTCCSGKCTNLQTDPRNCGFCGRVCPRNLPCRFGICGYGL